MAGKKYIAVQQIGKGNHAGSKARTDAIAIAIANGFEELPVLSEIFQRRIALIKRGRRFVEPFFQYLEFSACLKSTENDSLVLFQYPPEYIHIPTFFSVLAKAKKKKKLRYIALVHDLNSLRDCSETTREDEANHLAAFDALIVHNDVMAEKVRGDFAFMGQLAVLQLFDYLTDSPCAVRNGKERRIVFAGNLAKSGFCRKLGEIAEIQFNLYGPCDTAAGIAINSANVAYRGQLSPEEIVHGMDGSFGLVWDGDSLHGCEGKFGIYLRYNTSHKLSLYIVAGLPVIVWKQSAMAHYIIENNIGIAVDSLAELPAVLAAVSDADYAALCENVRRLAEELSHGAHLTRCLSQGYFIS